MSIILPVRTDPFRRIAYSVLMLLCSANSFAAEFRGIPADTIAATFPYDLNKPVIRVSSISGDGSTIGGHLKQTGIAFGCFFGYCEFEAFVWSHDNEQRHSLGDLEIPGERFRGAPKFVTAISYDGSTVLALYTGYGRLESVIYQDATATSLRTPMRNEGFLMGIDMSSDTDIVVGETRFPRSPFRWTKENGIESFAGIDAESNLTAMAISADGSTTVLSGEYSWPLDVVPGYAFQNAVRWSASDGLSELLPLEGFEYSSANAISDDGSVIVGYSQSTVIKDEYRGPSLIQGTMWIDSQPIALETNQGRSIALDVSADGKSIVGSQDLSHSLTGAGFHYEKAVLWRDGRNHILEDLLTEEFGLGDALQGWSLTKATAISDDGTVIAGEGFAPDGRSSAWVAILSVPEPSSCALMTMAGVVIVSTATRRS